MKKLFLFLIIIIISYSATAQGTDNYNKDFTKYDLYKWCSLMDFKPKYFEKKSFEDFLLKLDDSIIEWWQVEIRVTYENNQKGDDAMMFVFKKQLREFYGIITEEKFNKWYIPYYVFLQIDKWAENKIKK
jgi:hypothetical protein